jgi:tartrate dehydratase alpha subunit/fumarate hydratase class I-like protein
MDRMISVSRRARWNAAKRAALPVGICPVCMVRRRAQKTLKTTGQKKRMAKCRECNARDTANAARYR